MYRLNTHFGIMCMDTVDHHAVDASGLLGSRSHPGRLEERSTQLWVRRLANHAKSTVRGAATRTRGLLGGAWRRRRRDRWAAALSRVLEGQLEGVFEEIDRHTFNHSARQKLRAPAHPANTRECHPANTRECRKRRVVRPWRRSGFAAPRVRSILAERGSPPPARARSRRTSRSSTGRRCCGWRGRRAARRTLRRARSRARRRTPRQSSRWPRPSTCSTRSTRSATQGALGADRHGGLRGV
jgi:hypothetical protein